MSVTLPFEFNGKVFRRGRLTFKVFGEAHVDGVDFDVPMEYAFFMLTNSEEAERFLDAVAAAPLTASAKKDLLKRATEDGVERAYSMLQSYLHDAPCGKPRFYGYGEGGAVYLTDGDICIVFETEPDLVGVVRGLPKNIYQYITHQTLLRMNLEKFKQASSEIDEFFGFMKRLTSVLRYVRQEMTEKCFEMWFKNKDEATRLLKKIEEIAKRKRERDEVFEELEREKVLRCKGGFIVYAEYKGSFTAFYVTEDGCVFQILYKGIAGLKETVLRFMKKGAAPRLLREIYDRNGLINVAKTLGKVCPQLAVVIVP